MTASRTFGFAMLTGHGIPSEQLDEMFGAMHDFFALPLESKRSWELEKAALPLVGYGAQHHYGVESMFISGPLGELDSVQDTHLPPYWRSEVEMVEQFKERCQEIVKQLLRCFAVATGLANDEAFVQPHNREAKPLANFRLVRYPAPGAEESPPIGSSAIWTAPWSDTGSLVLIFQRRERVEVEISRNQWVTVPDDDEDAILVDLGDAVTAWSRRQLRASRYKWTMEADKHEDGQYGMIYSSSAAPYTAHIAQIITQGPVWSNSAAGRDGA